ncbi:hypothetical protein CYMTET_48409 [Cymbomonas tetramitiformis]|uniref:Uncharacterized protein n=1 Tax=Cymbomonas tetramitiformis TaxID=36881 RepID=A0AAE0BTE1_9CHLO|nr:hypothetical protein CYMTET_48409 [Cymbomonas tetramitiformis]
MLAAITISYQVAFGALLSKRTRQVHILWSLHALFTFILALYCVILKDRLQLAARFDLLEDPYYPANFMMTKRANQTGGIADELVEASALTPEASAEYGIDQGDVVDDLKWPLPQDLSGVTLICSPGVHALGRVLDDIDELGYFQRLSSRMVAASVLSLVLMIILETGYLPRFKSLVGLLMACGVDLMHFFGILIYLCLTISTMTLIFFGTQIEAMSTLQRSSSSLAVNFAGSIDSATNKEMKRLGGEEVARAAHKVEVGRREWHSFSSGAPQTQRPSGGSAALEKRLATHDKCLPIIPYSRYLLGTGSLLMTWSPDDFFQQMASAGCKAAIQKFEAQRSCDSPRGETRVESRPGLSSRQAEQRAKEKLERDEKRARELEENMAASSHRKIAPVRVIGGSPSRYLVP